MVDITTTNIPKPTVTKRSTPKPQGPKAPPAPPPDKTETFKFQGFELVVERGVDLPVTLARSNALPFKEWFSARMMEHGTHIFVPTTFWTEVMHKDPATATIAYARQRIRDQFNIWQRADPARVNHKLLLHTRLAGSTDHTGKVYPEGVSMFMEVTVPK